MTIEQQFQEAVRFCIARNITTFRFNGKQYTIFPKK